MATGAGAARRPAGSDPSQVDISGDGTRLPGTLVQHVQCCMRIWQSEGIRHHSSLTKLPSAAQISRPVRSKLLVPQKDAAVSVFLFEFLHSGIGASRVVDS